MLRQLAKMPPGQDRRPEPFLVNEAIRLGASAVVAAMSALEAFCSEMVGPDREYERTDRKGNTTTLNASQIEWLSIGERFASVLPALLGRDSIEGTKLADEFERIKDLRNAVVHPKHKEDPYVGRRVRPEARVVAHPTGRVRRCGEDGRERDGALLPRLRHDD
jgi:hypothetical protein